ncbi:MAG: hypothetical protein DMF89_24510 [Acidobacteria bacterium]|nr:MAG: hypothetical protein DMF89_24510 [Acidobacteriota bacterium]
MGRSSRARSCTCWFDLERYSVLKSTLFFTVALSLAATSIAHAALFGTLNGLVQDPQGRPVPLADVRVHSPVSGWQEMAQTDVEGRFSLPTVPAGNYLVSVTKTGFQTVRQPVEVRSGAVTEFRVALVLGVITETVEVVSEQGVVNPRSATTQTLVTRDQLESTPGALRANSLDMVTQYVPGATLVHDLLHIRGGHQISWSIDGVPVPNTNISSTVGPQLDPKDVETLEVHRGGYSAEFGDRTYGIFNVVTRSGFERNKEAEVFASYGSFNETNDQFSLGDHTEHFAYYSSFSVNRTDLALATPVPETIHAQGSAVSGFVSLVSKSTATDQFRVSASIRSDRYQIPNTPDQQAEGIDDHQRERDSFVNVSWMRTLGSQAFLTVSPFYHYTQFAYEGGPNDPLLTPDRQASHYAGGQAVLAASKGRGRRPCLEPDAGGRRQPHRSLRRGSICRHGLVDLERRAADDAVLGSAHRERSQPAGGGRRPDSAMGLGRARLLRPVLSGTSPHHCRRAPLRPGRLGGLWLPAAAGRAREPVRSRRRRSGARLGPRRRGVSNQRPQLLRTRRHRELEHLPPADHRHGANPGTGGVRSLASSPARAVLSHLFTPARRGQRGRHRRAHGLLAA